MVDLLPSVDQSAGLMENLLSWASSQQKGETINCESFDVNEVKQKVLGSLKALTEKKLLKVRVLLFPFAFQKKRVCWERKA